MRTTALRMRGFLNQARKCSNILYIFHSQNIITENQFVLLHVSQLENLETASNIL